jgi:hypothetical protein
MELTAAPRRENHALIDRIFGAALLRPRIYYEIKKDPNATKQGLAIVLLAGFADALWSVADRSIWWLLLIPFDVVLWFVSATVLFFFAKYLIMARTHWTWRIGCSVRSRSRGRQDCCRFWFLTMELDTT